MIAEPRNFTLDEELLKGEFVMSSVSLPNAMSPEELRVSKEYVSVVNLLEKQMVEKGWVTKSVSPGDSVTLRDIHVDQIMDYSLRDNKPTVFLAAVGYKTGKSLFIRK